MGKYIFLILIVFSTSTFSQNSTTNKQNIGQKILSDASIFFSDGAAYFSYPARMSSNGWIYTAGIAGGLYLSMNADRYITDHIGRRTIESDIGNIPKKYGNALYSGIATSAIYTVGLLTGEDEVRKVGRMLFQSLAYSGVTNLALKTIFGRKRPYLNDGPWKFTWFSIDNDMQAFPSGHTTVAFAFSTVLAEYFHTLWSRIGFYGIASLTAYSRVLDNQHWFTDVVLGALVGIAGGLHVISQEEQRESGKTSHSRVSFQPTLNGISLSIRLN